MNIKIITSTEAFYKLKEYWEKLQENNVDITYYNTYIYNKLWWEVNKNDNNKSLFIICVYVNKKIIGIAPFIIEKHKKAFLSYRVLKFMGKSDYFSVILDKTNNRENTIIHHIFKEINNNLDKWDRIELTHIKQNSSLAYYLLRNNVYNKSFTYLIECPVIYLDRFSSFKEYKKKFNINKEVKYFLNRLHKDVKYKLKVYKRNEENILKKISKIHQMEQKYLINVKNRKERKSLFKNNLIFSFLKKIYNSNDNVITFVLEDENFNILCYNTCYYYKKNLHCWNIGYNPQFGRYSISRILNYKIFEYIYDNNLANVFDFGAGRYPWKFKWTNDFVLIYKLDVWNSKSKKARFIYSLKKLKKLIWWGKGI